VVEACVLPICILERLRPVYSHKLDRGPALTPNGFGGARPCCCCAFYCVDIHCLKRKPLKRLVSFSSITVNLTRIGVVEDS